jgi:hypothetical protein
MDDPSGRVDRPTWERIAPLGGVAFVAVDLVAALLGGEPPATGGSRAEIARYYADHAGGVEAGLWLFGLGAIALIWWFAGLWRWMVRAEQGVPGLAVASLLGLAIAGALALTSSAVWATLALHVDGMGDDIATFHALGAVLSAASGVGLATHLLATNVLGATHGLLPKWLVVVGLVSATAWLVQTFLGSTSIAGAFSAIGVAAFVLWCVWILGVSHRLSGSRLPAAYTPSVIR